MFLCNVCRVSAIAHYAVFSLPIIHIIRPVHTFPLQAADLTSIWQLSCLVWRGCSQYFSRMKRSGKPPLCWPNGQTDRYVLLYFLWSDHVVAWQQQGVTALAAAMQVLNSRSEMPLYYRPSATLYLFTLPHRRIHLQFTVIKQNALLKFSLVYIVRSSHFFSESTSFYSNIPSFCGLVSRPFCRPGKFWHFKLHFFTARRVIACA